MPITLADSFERRIRGFVQKQKHHKNAIRILAEGDSWFTHGSGLGRGKTLIQKLNEYASLNIVPVANPGAELKDIVGAQNRDWRFATNPDWLKGQQYDLVLFSGGGNDIVGKEMVAYLKEWRQGLSGEDLIKKAELESKLKIMKGQYEELRKTVDQLVGQDIPILTHGYDYAHASGQGFELIGGLITVGPWILPSFKARKIDILSDQQTIIKFLVDKFNALLGDLANKQGGITAFHYMDLRNTLKRSDWDDELHPTAAGRDMLAKKILHEIKSV